MEISVELTFSPLQDDFENPLSTQVFGEYHAVMEVLKQEIKTAFELMDKGLLYMKIVKSDRSAYEPHF